MTGRLVIVATPIGNLADLAPRAVEVLGEADLICCEDTRHTGRLLAHAGVEPTRLIRVDAHTEARAVDEVMAHLVAGRLVAVVTDAGTPGVSDPGGRLVRAAVDAGRVVSIVPGPSAAAAALVVSGLPTERFAFEGFIPRRGAERARRLARLAREERTVVLFESPRRLHATLTDLADALGPDRPAAVARELTKLHEEVARGSLGDLAEWAASGVKGEVVIVVGGAPPSEGPTDDDIVSALGAAVAAGSTRSGAASEVAELFGIGRRRAYDLALTELGDPGADGHRRS